MPRKRTSPDDPRGRPNFVMTTEGKVRQRRRHPQAPSNPQSPGDGSQKLLEWRHEMMARYVALKNFVPMDAWRIIYDRPNSNDKEARRAAHLICACNEAVVLRMQYLTDQSVLRDIEHIAVTREWVEKEMVAAHKEAMNNQDYKAAIKALELLGLNVGMFVRRTDVTVRKTAAELGSTAQIVEQFVMLARKAFPGIPGDQLRTLLANHLGVQLDVNQIPVERPIEIASLAESLKEYDAPESEAEVVATPVQEPMNASQESPAAAPGDGA